MLAPGAPVTRFQIHGRSKNGAAVPLDPSEFAIASMLPMAAPPLPHTIAIELASMETTGAFDAVFRRHTPLPAEAHKTYRADRTLRPSDFNATLPIKFWEIEVSEDPQERWWAGCVHIRAARLKRPLLEGADIELTIKIDKSRKMAVDVFIPQLNQGFSNDVFVPDPPTARSQLQQQLDVCFERIDKIFQLIFAADREDLRERAEAIQLKLEVIAEQVSEEEARGNPDPDALLGPTEVLRKLRIQMTQFEEQLETERHLSPQVIQLRVHHRWTAFLVEKHGTDADKEMFRRLSDQLTRYAEAGDQRGLKFVEEQLRDLRAHLVWNQAWYWESSLDDMRQPGHRFLNQAEAEQWMRKAQAARERQDMPALREAVTHMWKLQPPDQAEAAREQAMQSGLKGL